MRPPTSASLDRARLAATSSPAGLPIVDVGGGRGDHAAVFVAAGRRVVLLDPASGMLSRAPRHPRLHPVRGRAEEMPLADAAFGLVWFHLSLHHTRWTAALDEALRVRDPRGRIEIWTFGEAHHATSFLGRLFPSVADLDRRRFPPVDDVAARLAAAGLSVTRRRVVEPVTRTVAAWIAGIEARFVSTLQALDPAELDAGLAELRRRPPDALVSSTLVFERLVAAP